MSGAWFPRADYERMGWSHQMIEHQRWLSEAACAATGAQPGDFSTFGDQEGLGMAFDYQAPAAGEDAGIGLPDGAFFAPDPRGDDLPEDSALISAVLRLSADVKDLCATMETKDQEIAILRERVKDLECLSV